MLGTVLKYTAVITAGAIAMVVGMHYSDDKVLERIREELIDARRGVDVTVVNNDFDKYTATHYGSWSVELLLTSSIADLDQLIAEIRA